MSSIVIIHIHIHAPTFKLAQACTHKYAHTITHCSDAKTVLPTVGPTDAPTDHLTWWTKKLQYNNFLTYVNHCSNFDSTCACWLVAVKLVAGNLESWEHEASKFVDEHVDADGWNSIRLWGGRILLFKTRISSLTERVNSYPKCYPYRIIDTCRFFMLSWDYKTMNST